MTGLLADFILGRRCCVEISCSSSDVELSVMSALVVNWRDVTSELQGMLVAIGNFDGVHRGHSYLLHRLAVSYPDLPLAVLTFEPHPREFFRPNDPPFRLTSPKEKAGYLWACGVKVIIQIEFDLHMARMSAEEFVDEVLIKTLRPRHIACGEDFAFGYRRSGNAQILGNIVKPLGIGLTALPILEDEEGPISSSRVRGLLREGQPERASRVLGHVWAVEGEVECGDKRGRILGFPTANIGLGQHLEPKFGVYAVKVSLPDGQIVLGAANIGHRPTFNHTEKSRIEVHLLDFSGELYGQYLTVGLHHKIREEYRFADVDTLKKNINQDIFRVRDYFARTKNIE